MTQRVGDFLQWMIDGKKVRRPEWTDGAVISLASDKRIEGSTKNGSWSHIGALSSIDTANLFATDWVIVE